MSIPTGKTAHTNSARLQLNVFLVNRAIVPTLWGGQLGTQLGRIYDQQVRSSWRFVPECLNDMLDWAVVVVDEEERETSGTCLYHLVYADGVMPDEGSGQCTTTLVLQGFLGAHALGILGNWRGKERDAQSASQFLVLESGGCDVPFAAQLQALDNIRRLVAMRVGGDIDVPGDVSKTIMLRRRVFRKVKATEVASNVGIALTDASDPYGKARAMAKRWCVDHRISVSIRRPNGTLMEVVPDALKRGDFVEVTVAARIEAFRSRKRRGVNVQFEMHGVVRLFSAEEVKVSVFYTGERNLTERFQCVADVQSYRRFRCCSIYPGTSRAELGARAWEGRRWGERDGS
ncbi:hypothetical protein FKP32DRAFT_1564574 [Trametes sanguinea]|nr:hypothetical protein FKP32DRAFT_1564574 [Trametes sanguinea]